MDTQDKVVQIGKYKVQVVRDLCIGAASCLAVAPATYELDEERKAVVLENSMDGDDAILLSAQACPTKAVIITDAETGEQLWPN